MIRLTDEEIEAIIRKRFCLFELDEEGEEDRRECLYSLLKAQLKKVVELIKEDHDKPKRIGVGLNLSLDFWRALLEEVKE